MCQSAQWQQFFWGSCYSFVSYSLLQWGWSHPIQVGLANCSWNSLCGLPASNQGVGQPDPGTLRERGRVVGGVLHIVVGFDRSSCA